VHTHIRQSSGGPDLSRGSGSGSGPDKSPAHTDADEEEPANHNARSAGPITAHAHEEDMKQHWSRDTEETRVTSVQLSLSLTHTHTHSLTYPHYSLFWKYGLFGFINTEENFKKESYFTNLLFLLAKCQIDKHLSIISHYSKSFSTNLTKTFNRFLFQRRPEKGEHCLVVLSSKSPFNLVAFYCPQFVSHLCL